LNRQILLIIGEKKFYLMDEFIFIICLQMKQHGKNLMVQNKQWERF